MSLKSHSCWYANLYALFAICLLTGICANGQNLIGYKGTEIRKYMDENCRNMSSEKVVNNKFKYLKYADNSDSKTLLFFINNDSICKSVRLICNNIVKEEKMKEFDKIYKRSGENRWIDSRNGINYIVELSNEKWSCVITIKPEK
ncbi:MAG: hypothetical protein LLG13_14990 [Bacteroidales bacterium]|nr:hypothetical protein [Bacteroidales bacterium]